MNYQLHYSKLVERAKGRTLVGYSEKHHIVPKCLGGDNSPENIVRLTPEEHYLAHQLLVKIHPGNHKLLWAAVSMTNSTKVMARNNKLYGWLRRAFAKELSVRAAGRIHSIETRQKIADVQMGKKRKPHSEEAKRKQSAASAGKAKSKEHRDALSQAKMGKKRGPHSPEHTEKIRQANIEAWAGRDKSAYQDEEYKRRQSEKMREIWAKRKAGELPKPKRDKDILED